MNRHHSEVRDDLHRILRAAVDAVEPGALVRVALERHADRLRTTCYLLAAGKAAFPMFAAAAELVPARGGLIAAGPGGSPDVLPAAELFTAGHPAPNAASVAAGERALALARESASRGGLLVLLSGGASAMLAAPVAGVALTEKLETARLLMAAGSPIDELNCVRKHLSRIKGGRLAAAARCTVTLALSDVHGPVADDPSVIGSGPTVPDPTTYADALHVIGTRGVQVPLSVEGHLRRGARGEIEETVKPGDARIRESVYAVIGNRTTASTAARHAAERLGYRAIVLPDATYGEAREAGPAFARAAVALAGEQRRICVIASGETTVTVRGDGSGGRNQEFVLAAALALNPLGARVALASAGTDGIDGPTDAAGAIADSTTLPRAVHLGLDARAALTRNDTYRFFAPLGDLILWGPTGTNVGDIQVMLFG